MILVCLFFTTEGQAENTVNCAHCLWYLGVGTPLSAQLLLGGMDQLLSFLGHNFSSCSTGCGLDSSMFRDSWVHGVDVLGQGQRFGA